MEIGISAFEDRWVKEATNVEGDVRRDNVPMERARHMCTEDW